ncbi:MAG TPA: GtrA family protein [Flavitalea sp.]|nr:GtrA family protein [Flavitalea sp.]
MRVFLKTNMASLIASLFDYCVTIAAVTLFEMSPLKASIAGLISGAVLNFLLGRHWVFMQKEERSYSQALRYLKVWCGNLILNTGGMYILINQGVYYLTAKIIISVLVAVGYNYPLQKKYVFKQIR